MATHPLFVSCPKAFEDLLVAELRTIGATEVKETIAGAHVRGTLETAYRIALWSRIASRLLLPIHAAPVATPEELYAAAHDIDWGAHMTVSNTFAVDCTAVASRIRHADYAALVVKDAIVDRMRSSVGERPNVDVRNPDVRVSVHIDHDTAEISIDLGGGSLHRRGYRVRGGEAPMKENVAAGLLVRARWPETAAAGGAFVDPMCGTGTILVEAAMIAHDIAPGLLRSQADRTPQAWRGNDGALWRAAVEEARERAAVGRLLQRVLRGYDAEMSAVTAARANLAAAGLDALCAVERCAVASLKRPDGPGADAGLIATNPPYGRRIGAAGGLERLYEELGSVMTSRFSGWRAAVLTGEESLAHAVGLRASKVNTVYNGAIRCVLATFELGADNRFVPRSTGGAGRSTQREQAPRAGHGSAQNAHRQTQDVHAQHPPKEAAAHTSTSPRAGKGTVPAAHDRAAAPLQPDGERKDVQSAAAADVVPTGAAAIRPDAVRPATQFQKPFQATGGILTFANRILKNRKQLGTWAARNGVTCYRLYDADLPEYAVAVDFYENRWLHVQEYVAPREVDETKAASRLEDIVTILPGLLHLPEDDIFVKRRHKRRRTEQYSRMDATGRFYEIHEGGLTFLVNLTDYLDTGLFLDHRVTREMIRRAARGKRFLNLFAYTATASVYAADGGAKETVSVDSSNTYLRWARENFTANRIGGAQHRLERGDCIEWLTQDSARYDLIFMDPPTFSNAKGKRETLDVQRDHPRLIELALRRLSPGGEIIFSTNFRRFRMELPQRVAAEVEDITAATIPRDFSRNRRIHQCFRIRAAGSTSL